MGHTSIRCKQLLAHAGDGWLPLACPRPLEPPCDHRLSRKVRQRLFRRARIDADIFEIIDSLNQNANYVTPSVDSVNDLSKLNLAVWRQVRIAAVNHSLDRTINSVEAIGELLGARASCYEQDTTVRPYAKQLVSWPKVGARVACITSRLASTTQPLLGGRSCGLMRRSTDFESVKKSEGVPSIYEDEVLRNE